MVNDKIQSSDSTQDMLQKMSEGNPGALTALTEVMNEVGPMKFMNFVMQLDLRRIYGSKIWIGYKDFCNHDAQKFHDDVMNGNQELFDCIDEKSS